MTDLGPVAAGGSPCTSASPGDLHAIRQMHNGYARYVAICPADWTYGVSVGEVPEAPLPRSDRPLVWDTALGVRVRR